MEHISKTIEKIMTDLKKTCVICKITNLSNEKNVEKRAAHHDKELCDDCYKNLMKDKIK